LDARVEAVLNVLAPRADWHPERPRLAIFEWGQETTPTDAEVRELAERIVAAVDRAGR
jgi:hypothetical protein